MFSKDGSIGKILIGKIDTIHVLIVINDALRKTRQIKTTQSELRFFITNHVKIEDRLQKY